MAEVETEEPVIAVDDEQPEDVEVEEEEEYVAVGGATAVKLFGKWSFDDIEVRDISLVVRYFIDRERITYMRV
jgi:small subunit ribosomal protein S5e